MGYTTDFYGSFEFNKPVEPWLIEYINKFSESRRMRRDNEKIKELYPKWKDLCFNGELGTEGEYFIGGIGFMGQTEDDSVLNGNAPARTQPGLWCDWVITEDGTGLMWNGAEKFYYYEEWLEYLIENFFAPLGYVLNGSVGWQGEDYDDFGTITVTDNVIELEEGIRVTSMEEFDDKTLIEELEKRGYKVS
jgi:hypothetical protein